MANIAALLKRIESGTLSYEEKLSALSQVEQSLQDMRQKKQEAIQSNVMLIVDALKQMQVKVEQQLEEAKAIVPQKGQKGDRGEKGDRGLDGSPGKDGRDGINGKDGKDGKDGISVTDAKIDFDGSLVITLSNGREINVGEVLPLDVSDKIKVIANGGGTSQTVVDTLTSLQNQINTLTGVDGVLGDMAQQNANNVAITGGAINGATIGGVTPAAGTFTTLTANSTFQFGKGSANYGQGTGGATTKAVEFKALGSDTNISLAIQSKGTGAIDLAAGSSGVNISNGGTVTAITRTATGSAYTGFPSVAITAPTTAGGVQATASSQLVAGGAAVAGGGTGYTNGDVLTVSTAGGSSPITITVTGVTGGVITSATTNSGALTSIPTSPVSVTGGTGTGATFNLTYVVASTFTITNAGSGYVEQPTVSFSGGGGSGAAAYASVGAGSIIRSLGSTGTQSLSFYVPSGEILRLRDTGSPGTYVLLNTTSTGANVIAQGSTNATWGFNSNGTGQIDFGTNGNTGNTQLRVSHTASAVNYVQVTGGATGNFPVISAQGSDATLGLNLYSKGAARINFFNNNGTNRQVSIGGNGATAVNYIGLDGSASGSAPVVSVAGSDTNIDLTLTTKGTGSVVFNANSIQRATIRGSDGYALLGQNASGTQSLSVAPNGSAVNYVQVISGLTTAAPVISALGSDTNIDLALTPKGTGRIKFGTHTATADTAVSGYIEIVDSGGTVRKLAVIT